MSTDHFGKQVLEGNTVCVLQQVDPITTNIFLVRVYALRSNNRFSYNSYSYDGISWFSIKEVTMSLDRCIKYIL